MAVGRELLLKFPDLGIDFREDIRFELVDQNQLGRRTVGNAFDLVLTEDVSPKHAAGFQCELRRLSVGREDDSLLIPSAGDDVRQAILGLNLHLHTPAAQVLLDEAIDSSPLVTVGVPRRERVEGVADQLQYRGLAGSTSANKAVESGRKLKLDAVEEASPDGHRIDAVR